MALIDYVSQPELILSEDWDCIILVVRDSFTHQPFESRTVQWIDWRLSGWLSQWALNRSAQSDSVTWVSTKGKIKCPWVGALRQSQLRTALGAIADDGMDFKRVLLFWDDPKAKPTAIKRFPEAVVAHESSQ